MDQSIVGYHQDEEHHWVAELACDHYQHVRHNPPWVNHTWVIPDEGRKSKLGHKLNCKKCDAGATTDRGRNPIMSNMQ